MRRSIPTFIAMEPGSGAEGRHRDGVSCINPAIYTFDANGHKRWCADCGAELGDRSWHPDGEDVEAWVIAGAAVAAALLVGLLALLGYLLAPPANQQPHPGTPGGPVAPSPYGPPPALNGRVGG